MGEYTDTPAPPAWLTGKAEPAGRAWVILILKAVVSLALLGLLTQKIDWLDMEVRLIAARPGPLLAALAILVAAVVAAALRWRLLMRRTGAAMTVAQAVQLTFAGLFFGQVLPATVGGDLARGVLACRSGFAWRGVLSAIVLDRVTALLASLLLILLGLPLLWGAAAGGGASLMPVVLASAVLAAGLAVALCADLLPLPEKLVARRWVGGLLTLAGRVRAGLKSPQGVAALALSVLIHVSTVAVVMLIGRGLGVDVPPAAAFAVVPVAILAAAVPVSLNGWGVREGVMVTGFALFGIASGDALLLSVLLGFGVILSTMPGSVTWLALR